MSPPSRRISPALSIMHEHGHRGLEPRPAGLKPLPASLRALLAATQTCGITFCLHQLLRGFLLPASPRLAPARGARRSGAAASQWHRLALAGTLRTARDGRRRKSRGMTLGQPKNPALPTPAPQTPTQRELGPKSALKPKLHVRSSGSAPRGMRAANRPGGKSAVFSLLYPCAQERRKGIKKK